MAFYLLQTLARVFIAYHDSTSNSAGGGGARQAACRVLDDVAASLARAGTRRATLAAAVSRAGAEVIGVRSEAHVAIAAVNEVCRDVGLGLGVEASCLRGKVVFGKVAVFV